MDDKNETTAYKGDVFLVEDCRMATTGNQIMQAYGVIHQAVSEAMASDEPYLNNRESEWMKAMQDVDTLLFDVASGLIDRALREDSDDRA